MVSPESLALIWLPEIDWSLFAHFIIELAAEFTGLLDFVRLIFFPRVDFLTRSTIL